VSAEGDIDPKFHSQSAELAHHGVLSSSSRQRSTGRPVDLACAFVSAGLFRAFRWQQAFLSEGFLSSGL
jgi:hypothetical protein